MYRVFWRRKGSAEPMPTPMPTPMPADCADFDFNYEQVFNWKNIRQWIRQTWKGKMEPVETNASYAQGMNWVEAKIAVLSATCFILLLMLVIPWLRSFIHLAKEPKHKNSGDGVLDTTNTVATKTKCDGPNLVPKSDKHKKETHPRRRSMENALWNKMESISEQEMDVLRSFAIDSASLEVKDRIGLGSFSDVHQGMLIGTPVAVKILRNSNRENLMRFKEELLLMKGLRHPNIVQLYGPCWNSGKFMIVTELFTYGNLANVLSNKELDLTWPDSKYHMICDVARGMAYLHSAKYYDYSTKTYKQCIVHRDLKPQNVLVTEGLRVKISDFGEARALDTDYTMTQVGTLLYIAPEIVRGEKYGEKCDVYSFGVLLFTMLIKKFMPAFRVFAEELERKKNLQASNLPVPTPPPPLNGGENSASQGSIDEGKNGRPAAAVPQKRKHTPHVVTEAIVNDNFRPELPEGTFSSLALLTRQAWDQDPSKRPPFDNILKYIETVVKDEVMHGVSINEDYPSANASQTPDDNVAIPQSITVDNDACSGGYLNFITTPPDPSPDSIEYVSAANEGLKNRIERIHMRSKGQYAPQRDRDGLHVPAPPLGFGDSFAPHQHQSELQGPFAVPSAAASRKHRHKSYGKRRPQSSV